MPGDPTYISAWVGAGTATIHGMTLGMIPGTTVTDGDTPFTAIGTARGITAGGTHPGIHLGITAGIILPGITVTADGTEADITAVSMMDTTPV